MRRVRALLAFSLITAACGDNHPPEVPAHLAPAAAPVVGGSQIARSKSFMLVTNVSPLNQQVASNRTNTLKPGLGEQ